MIFVEVSSDLAAAIIGNPDCRRTRVYPYQEKSRSQQKRRKFHIPIRSKLAPSNHDRSDGPTGVYPSNYGGKDVGPVLIRPSWEECCDRTCARGRQGRRQSFQTKRGMGPLCGVWLGRSTSMSSM